MVQFILICVFCFIVGYAIATAKYAGMENIGTLWVDHEMPESQPLLYLELNEGVGCFIDSKRVCMDLRIVAEEKTTR